jgi:hypothetical protein
MYSRQPGSNVAEEAVLDGARSLIGDWLISNGVMHNWRNDLDEESVMIGVVYGASMSNFGGQALCPLP